MSADQKSGFDSTLTNRLWPEAGSSRIPSPAYPDPVLYQRELERIFQGRHRRCVDLEAGVSDAGCFKRTVIGVRFVIMIRNRKGGINVRANRLTQRAIRFCQEKFSQVKALACL